MFTNKLKQQITAGQPAVNGWLAIDSAFSAEIMAQQGYDSLTIDLQHGVADYRQALAMLQAIHASGVAPMVRVPWLEPGIIMRMLDAGAHNVICPMVNSAEQARQFANVLRYPARGERSFGPIRASLVHGADYHRHANEQIIGWAMIETKEAVANVEAIAATAGVDGLYIGPSDLTLSLTGGRLQPGFDREEAEIVEVIQRILRAARQAGIFAGLHCGGPEYAARALQDWGFDLITLSGDSRLLSQAASSSLQAIRKLLNSGEPGASQPGETNIY